MNSNNPTYKNIVYGNISAGGDVHIGDVIYNVEQDFSHAILFFRLEKNEETNTYTANLSLKSKHKTAQGLDLLHQKIELNIEDKLFQQVNDFQQVRRSIDAAFRRSGSANPQEIIEQEQSLSVYLFDTFFKDDILKICSVFVALLEKRKIKELLLAISCDDNQVVNLPFELLIPHFFSEKLGQKRQSLAVNSFGFIRTLETDLSKFDMQGKMASAAPLKMLFVTALPENLDERAKMLEIEEEQKRLIDAIGSFEATGGKPKIVIEFLDTASLSEITKALQEHQHDILHISGHGSYDSQVKQGVLHLEDEDGNHQEVTGKQLGEHLRADHCLKLLILSACETAIAGNGVVEQLATFGVPAVVAMRFAVTDEGAKLFTTSLYKNLSQGNTLTHALAQAREELWKDTERKRAQNTDFQHIAEWFTPVVYLNQYCENLIDNQIEYVLPDAFYPKSDFFKTKNTRLIGSGFIGRKLYLNRMRRSFSLGEHVCLHGLGGLGKTTLAEAFAHNYGNHDHELIVFRNGTEIGEKQIIDEFFARLKDDEKNNKSILRQLEQFINSNAEPELKLQRLFDNYLNNGRKAIILFDNFEDILDLDNESDTRKIKRESLGQFLQYFCKNLPKSCHILITSRYVIEDLQPFVKHFSLEKMTYAEQYRLTNFSDTLRKIPLSERQDMIKRFDGHPRAYEFLETLFNDDKTLTWQNLSTSVGQVEARIWENLLLEKIYHRLSTAQQQVFQMAAICISKTPIAALAAISEQPETTLLPILKILQNWSLCHVDENGDFEVHRLTREWVQRNKLNKDYIITYSELIGNFIMSKARNFNYIHINDLENACLYYKGAENLQKYFSVTIIITYHISKIGYGNLAIKKISEFTNSADLDISSMALNELANFQISIGQLNDALPNLYKALGIRNKNFNGNGIENILHNIGMIKYYQADYHNAMEYFEKSLSMEVKNDNKAGIATSYHWKALINLELKNLDKALEYNFLAYELRKKSDPERYRVAESAQQIGIVYFQLNDDIKAIKYFTEANDFFIGNNMKTSYANNLINFGNVFLKQNNLEKAFKSYNTALEIAKECNDELIMPAIYFQIGKTHQKKYDLDTALVNFYKAFNYSYKMKMLKEVHQSAIQIGLIHFVKREFGEAYYYIIFGIKLSEVLGSVLDENVKSLYGFLTNTLIEIKQYDEFLKPISENINELIKQTD